MTPTPYRPDLCVFMGVFFLKKNPPPLSSHRLGILFHHPQTKFTKVMFSQVSVCPRGLSTPLHARIHPPDQRQTPPSPGTRGRHPPPPGADTPPPKCMLGDTGNKRVVRILLECILVICPSVYVFCQEQKYVINTRKRSLGQGNVFTPVCDSFCSQGGVKGIPPSVGHKRAVRILLECILVLTLFFRKLWILPAYPWWQQVRHTHPQVIRYVTAIFKIKFISHFVMSDQTRIV